MSSIKTVTISVSVRTKERLRKLGRFDETWDKMLSRLCDSLEGRLK